MRFTVRMVVLMLVAILLSSCAGVNLGKTPELTRNDSWEAFQARHEDSLNADDIAASELPDTPTLQQCQIYAAQNNPELQAAFYRWQAAVEEIPQAKSLPNPQLTYTYYFSSVETRVGNQRQALALQQTFPAWGKIQARTDAAASNAKARWQDFQAKKFAVYANVQKAWAELYYAQESVNLTRDKLALLEQVEQVLTTKYRTSEATQADLLRLQVDMEKIRNRLISFEEHLTPMRAALNIQLGRPARMKIRIAEFSDMPIVAVDREKACDAIFRKNPSLLASKQDITTAEDRIRLAKADYLPDVTLGIGWIDTQKISSANPPSHNGQDAVMGSIGFSLPIWYEATKAKVSQSKHARSMAEMQYNAMSLDIQSSLEDALFRHEDSQRRIKLYTNVLLPKAKESWKVTQRRYINQLASYNDMIDTLQILLEFELSLQEARAEYLAADGKLQELTTTSVDELSILSQATENKGKDNAQK